MECLPTQQIFYSCLTLKGCFFRYRFRDPGMIFPSKKKLHMLASHEKFSQKLSYTFISLALSILLFQALMLRVSVDLP